MFVPLLCAVTNALAALLLATWLAPGTTLVADPAARAAYVRENVLLWRLGWGSWIVATTTLLAFYIWWSGRLNAPRQRRIALILAGVGYVSDMTAQTLLIAFVPDRPELTPLAFALTGGVTNTLYTIGGILLSTVTPLPGLLKPWTAAVWAMSAGVSASVLFDLPLGAMIASAGLYLLFVPWCVAIGRTLAR
ncbi:MAG TPA: hypothetical protein VJQ09_05020 [Candidatus Limnocylindria bacterium]|nr:hypothetical protein [Candidatus Limnocylindria bacterium]